LVQESELGIEAAEKKACWDLANIGFGNRRRKSSQFFRNICLLVPLVTILFAQPIGTERLGGIKKTKGTHYSGFFLKMLIYTLSIDTESCTSSLRHARLARFEKTEVRMATRLPILFKSL
jgi:hypothetical protein